MTITIFGIRNCDTMKKARTWLADNNVAADVHDYKASGIDGVHLASWIEQAGWEKILNRAGTTFRKLPDDAKADLDAAKATALMLEQPSMIKRPVVEYPGGLLVGFKPEEYARALL
ncbi:MAG: ArsC family reductase [Pseudomonadota bacterium]